MLAFFNLLLALEKFVPLLTKLVDYVIKARADARAVATAAAQAKEKNDKDARNAAAIQAANDRLADGR